MLVSQELARSSYLIAWPRTGAAVVIDSERDVERYFENLEPISSCGVGTRASLEERSI